MRSFRSWLSDLIWDEKREGNKPPEQWRLASVLSKKTEWTCYECSLLDKHYGLSQGFFWKYEKANREWNDKNDKEARAKYSSVRIKQKD